MENANLFSDQHIKDVYFCHLYQILHCDYVLFTQRLTQCIVLGVFCLLLGCFVVVIFKYPLCSGYKCPTDGMKKGFGMRLYFFFTNHVLS